MQCLLGHDLNESVLDCVCAHCSIATRHWLRICWSLSHICMDSRMGGNSMQLNNLTPVIPHICWQKSERHSMQHRILADCSVEFFLSMHRAGCQEPLAQMLMNKASLPFHHALLDQAGLLGSNCFQSLQHKLLLSNSSLLTTCAQWSCRR